MKHRNLRRYFRHGTLTQLSVFEAVARHSSFTRAAAELHLAQPTVSLQVKKLAATLGLPLFEMVGKRVQMTAAGHELYAACQDIFVNIAEVEERLSRLRAPDTGTLGIGASTIVTQ
jgi:DNA-binding transcriptional LysR family regulator